MTASQLNVLLVTHGDTVNANRLGTLLSWASGRTWRIVTLVDRRDRTRDALLASFVPRVNAGVYDELWICDNPNYGREYEVVKPPAFGATRSFAVQYLDGVAAPRHNNSHMFLHRAEEQIYQAFGQDWNGVGMGYRAYKIYPCHPTQDANATDTTIRVQPGILPATVPYRLAFSGYDGAGALARPFEIVEVLAVAEAPDGADELTVLRGQAGTTARAIRISDQIERVPVVQTDFDRFTASAVQPGGALAGLGNCHTAPNATPEANGWDYDSGDTSGTHPNQPEPAVLSSTPDWAYYPNLTGRTALVDRNTWGIGPYGETFQEGPYAEGRLRWWLRQLPRRPGSHTVIGPYDGLPHTIHHDWWKHVAPIFAVS